jgi:hypothetical protein
MERCEDCCLPILTRRLMDSYDSGKRKTLDVCLHDLARRILCLERQEDDRRYEDARNDPVTGW